MTKLILAEKPSVARDLARALGVPAKGGAAGFLRGSGWVITWCIGHLVELEEPAAYRPAWRRWRLDDLPMLPEAFRLRAIKGTARQWRVVRELLRDGSFSAVVNACDAGREGELIFRYCYELSGSRLPVERLWISSLTPQAIAQGLKRLRPGRELDRLADAARSRAEADWLVGLNATRAVTLIRRGAAGSDGALCSLGRVQTPTLALLVRRERAIAEFQPRDYFEVRAELEADGGAFIAGWRLGAARRLGTREVAEAIAGRSTAAAAAGTGPVVESVDARAVREPPPLLFDLTALQCTANRRFGLSAHRTLQAAQVLYERHKLITYPRTDSRHLTTDHAPLLPKLWEALGAAQEYAPHVAPLRERPPPPPPRVFQNGRARDHHAIIPTPVALSPERLGALGREERLLHDLIARRFIGAFCPDAEFQETRVVVRVGNGAAAAPRRPGDEDAFLTEVPPPPDRYEARGRVRVAAGWQAVVGMAEDQAGRPAEGEEEAEPVQALPPLRPGQRLSGRFQVEAKQTRPPPRHSEATLLGAMESAGRSLESEELRQRMRDLALGTPATRAAIIETLLQRGYVERDGRSLRPTAFGVALIETLPVPSLASPELTGEWEARLQRVARGEEPRAAFMADIARYVQELIAAVRAAPPPAPVQLPEAPRKGRRPGRKGGKQATGRGRAHKPPALQGLQAREGRGKARPSSPAALPASEPLPVGAPVVPALRCPRCQAGQLLVGRRGWGCSRFREGCPLVVPFTVLGRRLSEPELRLLVEGGATGVLELPLAGGPPLRGRLRLAPGGSPTGFVYLEPASSDRGR